MGITPITGAAIGVGVATAIGVGIGGSKLIDKVFEKNPTGSSGDTPATLLTFGAGAAGLALAATSFLIKPGATSPFRLAAGIGAIAGAIGMGIAGTVRHGVGVDTEVGNVFSAYNHNWDQDLDLNPGYWQEPDYLRTERTDHTDSEGHHQYYTYTHYSIAPLAFDSDANHDGSVSRDELRAKVASFDIDGDGRLKGAERSAYERQYGERVYYGDWNW